jgi:peptidoglycan hydrolase CwlO-like protein
MSLKQNDTYYEHLIEREKELQSEMDELENMMDELREDLDYAVLYHPNQVDSVDNHLWEVSDKYDNKKRELESIRKQLK